jgi:hypothetical protein
MEDEDHQAKFFDALYQSLKNPLKYRINRKLLSIENVIRLKIAVDQITNEALASLEKEEIWLNPELKEKACAFVFNKVMDEGLPGIRYWKPDNKYRAFCAWYIFSVFLVLFSAWCFLNKGQIFIALLSCLILGVFAYLLVLRLLPSLVISIQDRIRYRTWRP